MDKTTGQINFDAYVISKQGVTYDGKPIPLWDDLTEVVRVAWQAGADAVVKCAGGETSDGYHTFNELYEHRNILFVALLQVHKEKAWWSYCHSDGTMHEGWIIAGLKLPTGDISYHLPIVLVSLLAPILELEKAPEWDGHTSDDVVKRLIEWVLPVKTN